MRVWILLGDSDLIESLKNKSTQKADTKQRKRRPTIAAPPHDTEGKLHLEFVNQGKRPRVNVASGAEEPGPTMLGGAEASSVPWLLAWYRVVNGVQARLELNRIGVAKAERIELRRTRSIYDESEKQKQA